MRSIVPRVAATATTFLALLGISAGLAHSDELIQTSYGDYYVPTGYTYVAPTSYSYVVPSSYSYVAPTSYSYVTPSSYSYVLPASYATTAYTYLPTSYAAVTPTYYETTYYRRPGLLRRLASRPVIETTRTYRYDVLPTTYYAPTTITYDAPVMPRATGYVVCDEAAVPFNPPPAANGGAAAAETSKSITSTPKSKEHVEPPYKEPAEEKAKPEKKATIPPDPAPEKEAPPGGTLDPGNSPPPNPGDPKDDRKAFRPKFTEIKPKVGATSSQPMLRGEVVSGLSGEGKEGLRVVFSDLKQRFPDREKTTDAKGVFEVFLPNGGWSVRVIDPKATDTKASTKEYGQITATEGRYLDDSDAPVYGLRLSY